MVLPAPSSPPGERLTQLGETFLQAGRKLPSLVQRSEIIFVAGLIAILLVMIFPLPPFLLDIFLAASFLFSLNILIHTLLIQRPLELSSFPTLLLLSTMLRLALNVASTRLILSRGHEGTHAAGEVIRAFGFFLMGGNFVIGVILFAILVIINFVVITKGSGRIAEVAARFSLDALPGKQMAVDAELSAGLITPEEAKQKRHVIQEEMSFYGAMDGAAKFVRGDAIAGLLITLINVVGGMLIGMVQQGVTFAQAASTYTVLTVGDGLVAQIPALIVSVASGLLVSKSAAEGSADRAVFGQMSAYPLALGMVAGLMITMGLLPGVPMFPFVGLGALLGGFAWYENDRMSRQKTAASEASQEDQAATIEARPESMSEEDVLKSLLNIDALRLEMGLSVMLWFQQKQQVFLETLKQIRYAMAQRLGFIMPTLHIADNSSLGWQEYSLFVRGVFAQKGSLRLGKLLVFSPMRHPLFIEGEDTKDPAFGIPARWVDPSLRAEAEKFGYVVMDELALLTSHIQRVLVEYAPDLLSIHEIQQRLQSLSKAHQKLYADLVPAQLPGAVVHKVLQLLVTEQVSLRDMGLILEGMSEASVSTKTPIEILEYVRLKLARQICSMYAPKGELAYISLSAKWESELHGALVGEGSSKQLVLAPARIHELIKGIRGQIEKVYSPELVPAIITLPNLRYYVRLIIERSFPLIPVLSHHELDKNFALRAVGYVE